MFHYSAEMLSAALYFLNQDRFCGVSRCNTALYILWNSAHCKLTISCTLYFAATRTGQFLFSGPEPVLRYCKNKPCLGDTWYWSVRCNSVVVVGNIYREIITDSSNAETVDFDLFRQLYIICRFNLLKIPSHVYLLKIPSHKFQIPSSLSL